MATPPAKSGPFRERTELLDFLLDVSRITSETLDLDQLLENVATIVRHVIPYDLFAILLYSERAKGLQIRYSIGHREEIVKSMVIPLDEGIVGAAASTLKAVMVGDVLGDPRYIQALDAVRSELAVPMTARGKLVGVLDMQSTLANAFTEQDRALLSLIGTRVGASMENARLYRRVDRQNRTLRTLAYLSQEFSSILALDELLGKIAASVRALINYDAFSIYLVDAEKQVLRHRFSVRYDQRVDLDNIPLGKGITGAAAVSGETVRVLDTSADPRYIASHPDIHSEMAVPLVVQDRVVGVLDVESARLGYFTEDHQQTLSLLAPQIASSIENARLYEELAAREQRMDQDLKAARKLQRVLQPREVEVRGMEVGIRARAARDVSGDVYEFVEQGDDYTVIAFGDVSGKGAAAALYGALVIGVLRILAPRRRTPAELMHLLNETLLERKIDAQYAALVLMLWEPKTKRLTLCNAGASPPFIYRKGEILKPRAEGVPIGLLENREYEQSVHQLETGDTVLLFSDGVEDQVNAEDQEYSRKRITRLLEKRGKQSAKAIADALIADLDAYRGETPINDDQTVVVMKVAE